MQNPVVKSGKQMYFVCSMLGKMVQNVLMANYCATVNRSLNCHSTTLDCARQQPPRPPRTNLVASVQPLPQLALSCAGAASANCGVNERLARSHQLISRSIIPPGRRVRLNLLLIRRQQAYRSVHSAFCRERENLCTIVKPWTAPGHLHRAAHAF